MRDMQSMLEKPLHAVIGLNRPGKPPQLTVVWFDWDGTTFRFSTTRSRAKYTHLQRDPRMSLLINDPQTNSYTVAYGCARIEDVGHAELAKRLFTRYLPDEDPIAASSDPDRVVIAMTPDRILTGS